MKTTDQKRMKKIIPSEIEDTPCNSIHLCYSRQNNHALLLVQVFLLKYVGLRQVVASYSRFYNCYGRCYMEMVNILGREIQSAYF